MNSPRSLSFTRRFGWEALRILSFELVAACLASAVLWPTAVAAAPEQSNDSRNLAPVAETSTSFVSGHETITALNDGFDPADSNDKRHGAYGNWPRHGTQWVQYDWSQPITTARVAVYWFDDNRGVRLPKACRLQYWDGRAFVTLTNATGPELGANQFNEAAFPAVTTSKLRLEMDGQGTFSTGVLEWRVYDTGSSPNFAPRVHAGPERTVLLSGATYLSGQVLDDGKPTGTLRLSWSKASGPGDVTFADPAVLSTSARFSSPGEYVLRLAADDGQLSGTDSLRVTVQSGPPERPLRRVDTTAYQIKSSFWNARAKPLIVHWIPHCIAKINDPKLPEGGIENFVQAGLKLSGKPHQGHVGAPFANAWVYNTVESICLALLVDPQGDAEIEQAQSAMRQTLEDWIPKILSAQEPDGYLHTIYTLGGQPRWSNKYDHEGYNAGYFLEAAMADYTMSGGKDTRLYDAAKRLADCWSRHIGSPPRKHWYEGHQEMEQALVRFGQFVDDHDGAGQGQRYRELAKFLLDCRGGGDEYDQSQAPVTRQYEAVGHSVRALYSYSGMAEVAMATGDVDYYSAVQSLWDSVVNRKYYVTGGIGSGETSEGFGKNFSLPNRAYCESCADCAELFFQHRLQRAYHQARYADLYEETLYNAVLGSVDLDAQNFTYTNPLDSSEHRYKWHGCPCCVGNIPRTVLMLPTWMYSTGPDSVYVNLFVGSSVSVGNVSGVPLRLEQTTDYPWNGKVSLRVQPSTSARFAVRIRVPNRQTSDLYRATPECSGMESFLLNGAPVRPVFADGYATLTRVWNPGDQVEFEIPFKIQRLKADSRIDADRGRVALRYGPLIYNFESVDQNLDAVLSPKAELRVQWKPDLLGGVVLLKGTFADGTEMTAVPNYARLNRGGRSEVWMRDE